METHTPGSPVTDGGGALSDLGCLCKKDLRLPGQTKDFSVWSFTSSPIGDHQSANWP